MKALHRPAVHRGLLGIAMGLSLAGASPPEDRVRETTSSPKAAERCEPAMAHLQALADRYVTSGQLGGIAMAIGRGEGPPIFIQAGSLSDDRGALPADSNSLWPIYSMTKPITGIAAMMLVEDGRIGLDQPVSDFIPSFRNARVLTARETSLDSHPAVRPITIRHLLTHSGGLTYQFMGNAPVFAEYKRLGLLGGRGNGTAAADQPPSLADFAERVASVPLLAEPGTQWHYSVSSDVLGRVIEVASGMPFERFVQTRLLDPLAMTSTFWTVPTRSLSRLARASYWRDDGRITVDQTAVAGWTLPPKVHYGGSGLVTSAQDYDRFLRMLAGLGELDGVRVLEADTARRAMSNLLPPGVRVEGVGTPDTDQAEGFGAGGWVYLADVPNGVKAGTFGWAGVAGTFAFIDPRTGLRVTVMVNYFPGNKWPIHKQVVDALYGRDCVGRTDLSTNVTDQAAAQEH
jgi:CubicO group peptidase (beta-lactamase class C family)